MFFNLNNNKIKLAQARDLKIKRWEHLLIGISTVLIILGFLFILIISAKPLPPKGVKLEIKKGATLPAVSQALLDSNVIRSQALFNSLMRLSKSDRHIQTGIYLFTEPENLLRIIWQLRTGDFGVKLVKVTIPEGANNHEVGLILDKALPDFEIEVYKTVSLNLEGRLFPDTYFLSPLATTEQIVERLNDSYLEKIQPLRMLIKQSGHTENEILTMASLLEEEAKDHEVRRMVAGILWKRLDQGMKLQVDAVFPFLINKNTFELTKKDLNYDSPYNTYKYKGLPPGPITNPGLDSIFAALTPKESDYLFYLSDKKGLMHYAVTYGEHLKNKKKYLGT
ncbi:MAG: hypothetical protein COX02_01370 [Candidatus Vogelbacteria bacterium CG22_combo_CG10-13_8_21_14_all_37_9]|uniref:Endolytic murein transglycosylase n=1 Tax=Candidatus Vogelbacteria bacterium CG22_combo_CG10-13_8_21_14_all_37_9 TaxID=1975046 RepID=A0A2H0BKW7_9BACT|nr:MAG: hypothetical protein BK005_01535 [bacterium CG10_37_50]PIP58244.1 MAG: hypothetical protein COX02_01370 [Candidatus Vogelbacteria bacterium CG22_combo_CG10-13_8_21_14_all_37_9]